MHLLTTPKNYDFLHLQKLRVRRVKMKCQNCKAKYDEKKIPKLNDWPLCAHCREHWERKLKERAEDRFYPPPEGIVTIAELDAHYEWMKDQEAKGEYW